ncbi:MAG: hypothetical protein EON86_12215 [Brevundimonas sp.]|nr:MAG: hypothetical protein EON86_12215 [Brevundimonas sp.]
MSLVEIARFTDVYEADLAAAFLESHGIPVSVTERHQTTIDPLMQRALGIRIMGAASNFEAARDLLARVRAGEFATTDDDDLPHRDAGARTAGTLMAVLMAAAGGFWGTSLPRRLRPVHGIGIGLILLTVVSCVAAGWWLVSRSGLSAPEPPEYSHW